MGFHSFASSLFLILCFTLRFFYMVSSGAEATRTLHIVYMGEKKHEDPNIVTASNHDMLTSLLGSKEEALGSIVYCYRHGFSGFTAMLTDSQAKKITGLPEVINVKPSRCHKLHTTRSWDFLGLNNNQPVNELLQKSNYGEDIIIGVIDSSCKE